MDRFRVGHAAHPDWQVAAQRVLAALEAQAHDGAHARRASLGIVYVSPPFGGHFGALVERLRERTGVAHWVGAIGERVCATGVEYADGPALVAMLADVPEGSFRVFSGRRPLPGPFAQRSSAPFAAHSALVHADPATPELADLVADMAQRTEGGQLFGGIVTADVLPATQLADEPVAGGLSGVLFSGDVAILSRVTQGCAPLGGEHVISACTSQFVQALDGRPALDVLLDDLDVPAAARRSRDGEEILRALPAGRLREGLFAGLAGAGEDRSIGFGDYAVRSIVGIDPQQRLLAVAAQPAEGDRLVFCTRDAQAARRDLVRVCTELRSELEERGTPARGALYHTCVARGAHLFGAPGAELGIVAHNLGDVPLAGFSANGEIARGRIYGHSGVLTVFL